RSALYDVFQAFDFPDPSVPNGERARTTVAPQALFMLNGKLMQEQTRKMAESLLAQRDLDGAGRVRLAYEMAYGRPPTGTDVARALDFMRKCETMLKNGGQGAGEARRGAWQSLCRAMLAASEFVYAG